MRCPRCGKEVQEGVGFCQWCGTSLVQSAFKTHSDGRIESNQTRYCVSCGRTISWGANVCPYCGHDYRTQAATQYAQTQPEITEGLKIVFYVLSLLMWIVGIIIGLVLYTRPDPESQRVGKMCIILGCVSILISIILSVVLYIMILGFGG